MRFLESTFPQSSTTTRYCFFEVFGLAVFLAFRFFVFLFFWLVAVGSGEYIPTVFDNYSVLLFRSCWTLVAFRFFFWRSLFFAFRFFFPLFKFSLFLLVRFLLITSDCDPVLGRAWS